MGISYYGGMLVGDYAEKLKIPDSILNHEDYINKLSPVEEFLYEMGLEVYNEVYDADKRYQVWGFPVKNIMVNSIDNKWLDDIRDKAKRFHDIFGVPAKLIGSQNII